MPESNKEKTTSAADSSPPNRIDGVSGSLSRRVCVSDNVRKTNSPATPLQKTMRIETFVVSYFEINYKNNFLSYGCDEPEKKNR